MASASEPPPAPLEVPPWLKTLPVAPEYHPTAAEFQDPIAYILKIEKEAAAYGICKIVPPLPSPPKKTAVANLNRSFAARDPNPKKPPTFTTRQQQIGFCPRRPRPVQKPVWQSGEHYTLQQFEAKAKQFERAHIKRAVGSRKASSAGGAAAPLSPLEVETLFWKASADKPFSVEYANDMPGSGFAPLAQGRRWRGEEDATNVGETAWNMRGVSRAKGSLLRFMKEEIPGVTSPMIYVAMMFSWFAWHVEDHELHSLNYLHMGSGKTWYGVPRDAGLAFEEAVRMQGYGGEVNPLVTFAILGEKTTVMSPEVLVGAGIPCCRLVQNAGEFVVTFPGAYHSGFSLGFNCGEAANIATPGWLSFAKEAAIRRASINYPPMVSHYQLLYSLALSLTRVPIGGGSEPRSSRLKDKMKGEGEEMIKKAFAQNVIQNNHLLNFLLGKGSSCIVLPQNATERPLCPNSLIRPQIKVKPRLSLGLCSQQEALEASRVLPSNDIVPGWNSGIKDLNGIFQLKGSISLDSENALQSETCDKTSSADFCSSSSDSQNVESEKQGTFKGDGLLDQGLLSCVTCGVLSFSCVAVVQPTERAAKYLMSAECGFLSEIGLQDKDRKFSDSEQVERDINDRRNGNLVHCRMYSAQDSEQSSIMIADLSCPRSSALDLLASAYGDSSDVEEDVLHEKSACMDENDVKESILTCNGKRQLSAVKPENFHANEFSQEKIYLQRAASDNKNATSAKKSQSAKVPDDANEYMEGKLKSEISNLNNPTNEKCGEEYRSFKDPMEMTTSSTSDRVVEGLKDFDASEPDDHFQNIGTAAFHQNPVISGHTSVLVDKPINYDSYSKSVAYMRNASLTPETKDIDRKVMNSTLSVMQRTDKDSSRMHVFCLQHAAEVEKLLQPIGGVHMMLLCHPDYPKIEAEAKVLTKELGIGYTWRNIHFRETDSEAEERIRQALEDEEVMPMNSDWSVKLGINMYYTANLSKSPLYSKQMPYNSIIYRVYGHNSSGSSPVMPRAPGRRLGRQRKIVVAGRWCGKVWMSNQVHPYLIHKSEVQEQEQVETLYSDSIDESLIEIDNNYSNQATPSSRRSFGNMADMRSCRKKRKMPLRKGSSKKFKNAEVDSTPKSEDITENSASSCRRLLRSSRVKNKEKTIKDKLNVKDETGGPSSRLRKRPSKSEELITKTVKNKQTNKKKTKKTQSTNLAVKDEVEEYTCDLEGCSMSFSTKHDLTLHKRDICPVKGCGKKFFSHKYLVQHRKVHMDDRPLVCPWKGCKMTFKWAWARTEHIRVHTGDRPYICHEPGCGQTFRFVSDFSRHKRKTGHSTKKSRRY